MGRGKNTYECAVIGGGPGGLVTALYLKRFQRSVVVIDAGQPRAQWIPRLRNLVGYSKGLSGLALLHRLHEQVTDLGTEIIQGTAQVRRHPRGFEVMVNHQVVHAKRVALATGMTDIQPTVENLAVLRRAEVLAYCPICDGYDHSKEEIAVLVNSPKGLKKVKFLARFSPHLHVVQTKPFKISGHQRRVFRRLNLKIHRGQLQSLRLLKKPKCLAIKLRGQRTFQVRLAYVAMGVEVDRTATKSLRGLRRTREGFIIVTSHQETSIPGLYAVGDCVNALSQVSVAVGQAAIAATRIHNDLK